MSDSFELVFAQLRATMLAAAPEMVVAKDDPGSLELRTPAVDLKTKQPGWFGTVTTKKSYVAYHLMPLYTRPELADGMSPGLTKRKQGKTCFNFVRHDDALIRELAALTSACVDAQATG